ncbi:PAS domain S-box protein [Methanosarcina sp.]|uniref:PAS domain S-box protein n=1 Tax=Methanosarcina sp. TaxID=2213 RepID=UPI003C747F69
MTVSDRLSADKLDKTNKELRAEIFGCKRLKHELIELKDKLEVEVRDTSILHKLSTRYIEGSDSFSIFQEMVEAAIAITRADKGNIQILDLSTGKLKIEAQRGFSLPFLKFFEFVGAGEAATCGAAMEKMERVVVEDITHSPIFSGSEALDILLDEGVKAVQSTPLFSRSGKLLGIISTHFSQVHTPDERELRLIDILARQAADIIERQKAEEELCQSERRTRLKLENLISPSLDTVNLELAEIINIQAVHSLMEDFHKFAHITMALIDLKGNVLVAVGWQDICTRFHRFHPETCKYCVESDTELSKGILPGEFKLYRCKNNMWDIATPIMVGGQRVGSIFSGQFFFEDEPLDYELFRAQARKYGFNEEQYIDALEKVPRLSREAVDTSMAFFTKLANVLSQLSYSNFKLTKSLLERDSLLEALRESEERFRWVIENSLDAAYRRNLQTDSYDYMSPVIKQLIGFSAREIGVMSVSEALDHIHPDDRSLVTEKLAQAFNSGFGTLEYRFRCKDGQYRWFADHFTVTKDQNRKPLFSGGIVRDITERKQAENELKESEKRFRTLAENSPDAITRFNIQNRYMYANPAAAKVYSLSQEEIIGKTHSELGREPELVKFWEECHQKVFAAGKPETMEFQYISPQGKEYYFNTRVVPEFVNGKVASILAISRDIKDKKEAESRLKETLDNLEELVKERTAELEKAYTSLEESEKGLAEAQKMAHIGNWDCNFITCEVNWSDELYRIFGCDPKKLALSYNEYLDHVHPDDRDYVDDAYTEAINGSPLDIDHRIVLANGEVRTVHIICEVISDEENIPIRAKGIVQDITERKKTEEKIQILANAVESSNDAILTKSLDGIITSWNKGAEQVYGYSAEEILGKNISVLEPANLKGEIKQLTEKIKNDEKVKYYETLRLKKDGTLINLSVTLSPIFNLSGELVAISAISRDITERKKAEETLVKIEDARKKEIHHRIKNNLQVISSLLDLQAEKFVDNEVLEAFRESQDRVFSMSLIHEELYRGQGTDTLDFSAYLQKLAENLFQTYSLKSRNLSLLMDLEENAFFDMDIAVPLGIIVNELVSNSLKHAFTENGKGNIQIRLCREEKNDEIQESLFSLTISDNGKGIPENIEFERLDSLGLQLVSTLVDQLDGKIEIKREQGTEFRITFNLAEKSYFL